MLLPFHDFDFPWKDLPSDYLYTWYVKQLLNYMKIKQQNEQNGADINSSDALLIK